MSTRKPYVIIAPEYKHSSAGIKVLHRLGHLLNCAGQSAYIYSVKTNPKWNITSIPSHEGDKLINDGAIVVYPEIIKGHPQLGKTVVRYIMNNPGYLGGETAFLGSEIIYCYLKQFLPPGLPADRVLCIPVIDRSIFYPPPPGHIRDIDYLVFFGRRPNVKGYPENNIIYSHKPSDPRQLGEMFRRCKKFISYENLTALTFEATLCGCPAVIIPDGSRKREDLENSEYGMYGIAWGDDPAELKIAEATVDRSSAMLDAIEKNLGPALDNFIKVTQDRALNRKRYWVSSLERSVSLIMPNHNGLAHLQKNLPVLIARLGKEIKSEIIIVDNGSSDGGSEFIKQNFPDIKLLSFKKALSFAAACNAGAKIARNRFLFFLNSDIRVTENFLPPLIKHFEDPDLFAVTPSILVPRMGNLNEALTSAFFKGGAFNSDFNASLRWQRQPDRSLPILYACGAAMVVDREKFEQLGGFDEMFDPFYYEDLDLSYRARRRGWEVMCEPRSVVYHDKGGTIASRHAENRVFAWRRKNHYLFVWKNIFDRRFLASHLLEMVLLKLILPNPVEWSGLWQAWRQLPRALAGRREEEKYKRITDRAIMNGTAYLLETGEAPWEKQ